MRAGFSLRPVPASGESLHMPMEVTAVTLTGRVARLEPLEERHLDDLARVSGEEDIWRFFAGPMGRTRAELEAVLRLRTRQREESTCLTFAIVSLADGRAVGSSSYFDIAPVDRRLEIGSTWLGAPARRTGINTECKYLLLRHAFEALGANRVQLKTDSRNLRSQAAIERIGAVKEGVLRAHLYAGDGVLRDTVMYSVIAPEWPAVKARLEGLMAR
jgi:RimJ/RimL family protein N-acetyltransferase